MRSRAPKLAEIAISSRPRAGPIVFLGDIARPAGEDQGERLLGGADGVSDGNGVELDTEVFGQDAGVVFECWLEMTDGRLTPMTFFGPRASAAMTAVRAGRCRRRGRAGPS